MTRRRLDLAGLDGLYKPAMEGAKLKVLDKLDRHCAHFISLSPFMIISAAGADGAMDVSPRGGAPGFVHVADAHSLLIPDRPGNNRLDVLRNILAGSGHVGMLFLIPGLGDCLRVNGRASVVEDEEAARDFLEFDRLPSVLIHVSVDEAFLHCPKSIMRSKLWSEEAHLKKGVLPSAVKMLSEQVRGLADALPSEDRVEQLQRESL